ncbi:hypothetical protein AB6E79_04145 [Vibrio lentus]
MEFFYLEPSTLVWDKEHFIASPHSYDDVINDVIELLELEEVGEIQLTLLYDFVMSILDYYPFETLEHGHWPNSRDFITQVSQSVSKWMSSELMLDDIDQESLLDTVSCSPPLIKATDPKTFEIKSNSSSCLYNKNEFAVISFNPKKINLVTLTKFSDNGDEVDIEPRPLFNTFQLLQDYLENNKLTCEFSKKHHPTSGWGSRMLHEDMEIMQPLLETSCFSENNEFRVRYAYCERDSIFYAFRVTNGLIFHPYPVERQEVPHPILQQIEP